MNFSSLYENIVQNKKNHEKGYYNCIPFMGMERLEKVLPGIEQSCYTIIGANSGIGKSKLARFLYIHSPIMYLEQNPDYDVKFNVLYFSLEESKEKIIKTEICKYLHTKYQIIISVKELSSVGRYNTITEDVLLKIKEAEEYVNNYLKTVKIWDNIRNPTGIYKAVRDFAMTIGTYYYKDNKPFTKEDLENIAKGEENAFKKVSYYKKHHNRHFVVVIIDHISLLSPEQGKTLWQSMGDMSSKYCLHMRDKFGFSPVVVQQFTSDKEKIETNFQGKTIEEKLEPSLDAFADNKGTIRDANIVLGLFGPDRYRLLKHNDYDITFFKDNYRSLSILKSRDGAANKRVPLFFNGAIDFFKEMPRLSETQKMINLIKYVEQLNGKK